MLRVLCYRAALAATVLLAALAAGGCDEDDNDGTSWYFSFNGDASPGSPDSGFTGIIVWDF